MSGSRRITLVACSPKDEIKDLRFDNYGVRRIQAALHEDLLAERVTLSMVDLLPVPPAVFVQHILETEPGIVGFSAYLWSFPILFEVATLLRAQRPDLTLVFGGPCAHPAMFSLPPYREGPRVIDALAKGRAEATIRDIVRSPALDRASLAAIPGLWISTRRGERPTLALADDSGAWRETAARAAIADIDSIPSPYQLGLMRHGGFAYLNAFDGCPLSCTYCEWGAMEDAARVHSTEYMVRELEAWDAAKTEGAMMVDAALNLNARAFESLRAAEEQVGYFKHRQLLCELYPSAMTDEHLAFLSRVERPHVGVGLQSMDPEVLAGLDRPFDERKFERVVKQVAEVAAVTVELILGLPGDNYESFHQTLERLRQLPVGLRVYHCVVLPAGLMTRGGSDFAMQFDPVTLKMEACRGWTADSLLRARASLDALAKKERGVAFDYWWGLPGPTPARMRGPGIGGAKNHSGPGRDRRFPAGLPTFG
jgi:radical SAM superfamily enzyme YgiQ (UPF0313 family)